MIHEETELAGAVVATLTQGIAQLIIPQGADQFLNADACTRSGAALTLPTGEANARTIDAAARHLLDEPTFARAARAVRAEIAAMPDAREVLKQLTA